MSHPDHVGTLKRETAVGEHVKIQVIYAPHRETKRIRRRYVRDVASCIMTIVDFINIKCSCIAKMIDIECEMGRACSQARLRLR